MREARNKQLVAFYACAHFDACILLFIVIQPPASNTSIERSKIHLYRLFQSTSHVVCKYLLKSKPIKLGFFCVCFSELQVTVSCNLFQYATVELHLSDLVKLFLDVVFHM